MHDPLLGSHLLAEWPIEEVWGVGRASAKKLRPLGIATAADLAALPPANTRSIGTVVLERLVRELNGVECDDLQPEPEALKATAVTRSFGEPVSSLPALQEAMARRAWRAAEKIRAQELIASRLIVFAHGSRFKAGTPSASRSANLSPQSNDPRYIINVAMRLTEALFADGASYTKCGVLLEGLVPSSAMQGDLFVANSARSTNLLSAVDDLNGRFGRGTIQTARQGFGNTPSDVRRSFKSPAWTTRLCDIPKAN